MTLTITIITNYSNNNNIVKLSVDNTIQKNVFHPTALYQLWAPPIIQGPEQLIISATLAECISCDNIIMCFEGTWCAAMQMISEPKQSGRAKALCPEQSYWTSCRVSSVSLIASSNASTNRQNSLWFPRCSIWFYIICTITVALFKETHLQVLSKPGLPQWLWGQLLRPSLSKASQGSSNTADLDSTHSCLMSSQ